MATRVKVHVQPQPSLPGSEALSRELIEAYLTDISRFGLGLLTHSALPPGARVDLEFPRAALPLVTQDPPKGEMRITGQIVHVTPLGDQFQVGISFVRLDETDQLLIERALARHSVAGYTPQRRRAPRLAVL